MRYPDNLLEEIRARLPVSQVVGRKVRLKKQGREWRGLSPFNAEKTPSFYVNDQKGFYHDFSSGKHGDIFRFLMETEGLSFREAVERLAGEAGVTMPKLDARTVEREKERASLAEVVEMAAKFFEESFRLSGGETARAYARKRNLAPETIREFRIGYAPSARDALKRHLTAKGVDEAAMVEAGLLIRPDDGRPTYDRFRDRLIIPIQDERGRVVAFGGRALAPENEPKYLNSPETPLFSKGHLLFNAHRARQAAHEGGTAIVVEGYLDAIAVWQAGVKAIVATLGTAFTEDQIARLWRLAPEPVICFDGDKAGVRAAHRAVERILPQLKSGFSFNFCFLDGAKDPDELVQSGGKDAFLAEIARAVPLADVVFDREAAAQPIDTPERRAALEKRLEDLVAEIKDTRVARSYRLAIRLKLSQLFYDADRRARGERRGGPAGGRAGAELPGATATLPAAEGDRVGVERLVLGLALEYPELLETHLETFGGHAFLLPAHEGFKRELYRLAADLDGPVAIDLSAVDPRFFFVVRDVYGEEERDGEGRLVRARGARLTERLPVLKLRPPPVFVEACFTHFLDKLDLRTMEADLDQELGSIGADCDEADEARILGLTREIARRREELARSEQELAEEARRLRGAYGAA